MDGELTLRRYEPADAEQVWSLHERALRASELDFLDDAAVDDDITDIPAEYLDAGGEFLVGLIDGDVIVMGGFQPRDDGAAELRRMRVDTEHQRQGYASRLLEALEARARAQGFARLILETHVDLTAARQLYEGHGYDETGRKTRPPMGDEFVIYSKEI